MRYRSGWSQRADIGAGAGAGKSGGRQATGCRADGAGPALGDADARSRLQPLTLAVEQVNFHVGLFVDFIVTGAQLVGRQVTIPGTLLQDLGNGTPLPVALSRAVRTFAEIELDAGRELIGFAAQYVDFQVRFIAKVLQAAVAVATAIPVAVGELVTSTVSHFTPAPATGPDEAPSVRAAQQEAAVSPTTTSENDALTDSKAASSPTATESTVDSDDETKVSAQGEIRSNASTDTADVDATESTADEATPLVRRTPGSPRKR